MRLMQTLAQCSGGAGGLQISCLLDVQYRCAGEHRTGHVGSDFLLLRRGPCSAVKNRILKISSQTETPSNVDVQ